MTSAAADSDREGSRRTARRVLDLAALALTIAVAWFMWPATLGGSRQLILVQGRSMEPTYDSGDLVVLDTDATPGVGEVVVFKIPGDQLGAGQLVVHRITGVRDDGTFVTQGDNSQNADDFRVTQSDILGSPQLSIPHGGRVLGLLSTPLGVGVVSGVACTIGLWPRKRQLPPDELVESEAEAFEPAAMFEPAATTLQPDLPSFQPAPAFQPAPVAREWVSSAFSEEERAEAEAWLRTQLVQVP